MAHILLSVAGPGGYPYTSKNPCLVSDHLMGYHVQVWLRKVEDKHLCKHASQQSDIYAFTRISQ